MTWADFYLICFAAGFAFSFLSFLMGGTRGRLHLPHFPHGHATLPHAPVGHAPAGSGAPRAGGAEATVRDAAPAAMSPAEDQITMSPPRSVKMRPTPRFTSPSVRMSIAPPDSVMMPGGISGLPML